MTAAHAIEIAPVPGSEFEDKSHWQRRFRTDETQRRIYLRDSDQVKIRLAQRQEEEIDRASWGPARI